MNAKKIAVTSAPRMKKSSTVQTLSDGADAARSLFTSTPPSKKMARAEADAAAKTFLAPTPPTRAADAASKKGKGKPVAVKAPRAGTNKSRALAALANSKAVAAEALTEAVYGDKKGYAVHAAGMAGVLIGVSLAAAAAGKKLVKTGKGAAASYLLK